MIRVLQVIGSLNMGGSQAMIMNLYRAIDRSKVQFDFVIFHDNERMHEEEITKLGGKVYYIEAFSGKNLFKFVRDWKQFLNQHLEYKIIHGHVRSVAAIYLAIAKNMGRVTIAHSHSTSNGKGILAFIKDCMQLPIRYIADYMFACSEEAGKWLFGKNICYKKNFKVIQNAINLEEFNYSLDLRSKYRSELGIEDKFVIGHVGRFHVSKNHMFLLNVFVEVTKYKENAVLLLVGAGELEDYIRQEIDRLNLQGKVIMLGNRTDIPGLMQSMDIFVFPSIYEGLGIVVIEAQAAGLSCVMSEKIPKEIDVEPKLVTRVPLEGGIKEWAQIIVKKGEYLRERQGERFKQTGYDIRISAKEIQEFYIKNIKS